MTVPSPLSALLRPPAEPPRGGRNRVLIVEDEIIIALGLQQDLIELGYDVPEFASNEVEAVPKAERLRPDVVLMDVNLRGLRDGIEVAAEIYRRFEVPSVFLTAYVDDLTLERAKGEGTFGYLVKPYELRELHTTLQLALVRHRAQAELRRAHDWLQRCLESLGDAVLLLDPAGGLTYLNPQARELLGAAAPDPGTPWRDLVQVASPEDAARLERLLTSATAGVQPVRAEADLALGPPAPRPAWVQATASGVRSDRGGHLGSVLVLRDMTERRARERENARLRSLDALGRLAGGLAHDFNNLLHVVVANTSLLRALFPSPSAAATHLERIQMATERATVLTNQFLTFAQGGAPVQREVPFSALLGAALRHRPVDPPVRLQVQVPDDLRLIQADEAQLGQALANLIENAIEAMPQGGDLTITAANGEGPAGTSGESAAGGGPRVTIDVADTGRGILPEHQDRLFEPYFTTKPGGTGLGLASVHSVVTRHRGRIEVSSRPGEGTHVRITLPASATASALGQAGTPGAGEARTRRILVMDDEEMVRVSLRRMLESLGFEVEVAADGEEALAQFLSAQQEGQPFAAVFLDLIVPRGMGGEEAVRQLLRLDPAAHVVVSSGYSAHPVMSQYEAYGFRAVMQKPFGLMELRRTLQSLGLSPQAGGLSGAKNR